MSATNQIGTTYTGRFFFDAGKFRFV